jgi:hypothetical protein
MKPTAAKLSRVATTEDVVREAYTRFARTDAVLEERYNAWRNERGQEHSAERVRLYHLRRAELHQMAVEQIAAILDEHNEE